MKFYIITKQINDLGYSIVSQSGNEYAILDFSKDKINNQYIGFKYSLEDGLTNSWNTILDKDFAIIKEILK